MLEISVDIIAHATVRITTHLAVFAKVLLHLI